MAGPIDRLFFEHPQSVDESYVEHFKVASGFGVSLIGAGLAALIHAFVPCLFQSTASREIRRLHARIEGRGKALERAPG